MEDIEKEALCALADELLEKGKSGTCTRGGGIFHYEDLDMYTAQDEHTLFFKTKEEAALDWIKLKIRGKI